MRVLMTGATGFIGRSVVARLQRDQHTVVAWTRSETRARRLLGPGVDVVPSDGPLEALGATLTRCDAIVNLAGEPLMGRRWSASRRAALEASRIGVTEHLVRALVAAQPRPRTLVSASAVGIYGDRGSELLTEASTPGDDFLAQLCQRWERAAAPAEAHGVRVILLRAGVVLGKGGGALAQMLPPFKIGVGGPIGSGQQYLPWIHLHDHVRIIAKAIEDDRYRGPINGVAPEQVTNRTFARTLGRALHRPALLPVPAGALTAIFGEAATVLLASQRVEPGALTALRFTFDFPTLDAALTDIVTGSSRIA